MYEAKACHGALSNSLDRSDYIGFRPFGRSSMRMAYNAEGTHINTAKPPSGSTNIVIHAIKCGRGTPSAWRIEVNASGPLRSLA
jgi:hypothetical protein